MNVLMVAGGMVDSDQLKETWKELDHPYVFGVDKGCIYLLENNIPVSKAVGDFDSLNEQEKIIVDRFFEKEQLQCEKDDTDTEHALRMAVAMKPDKIVMLGCTGTRLDQTMVSIRLLKIAAMENIDAYILDTTNRIRVVKGMHVVSAKDSFGKYVSVLPFGESMSGLKISGLKYEVRDVTIEADSSLGISNELTHDAGLISCDDYYIVMETKD